MKKRRIAFAALGLFSAALAEVRGGNYTVNTSSDNVVAGACENGSANCSLRGAIMAANASASSTINFSINEFCPISGCAIGLQSALPSITQSVTIGPTHFVIQRSSSASTNFRIFNVATNGVVNFTGLTISNGNTVGSGNAVSGAGINNGAAGTVNVTNCTISGNTSGAGGSGFGGGLCNSGSGTLNVINCTISGNSAANGSGGAIASLAGTVNIINSTITGNTSGAFGAIVSNATLNVTNSTITGNTAGGQGGGIRNAGTATVKSSIIAGNSGDPPDVSSASSNSPFTSAGFNLIGKRDGGIGFPAATDQTGTIAAPLDPKLDPGGLKGNGGPTRTIALLAGSPALDRGSSAGLTGNLTTDQRGSGFPRTSNDFGIPDANGGDGTDIGAFELQAPPPTTLGNISTRLAVQTGDNVLIGGFIVTGTHAKKVILRAIGPSLNLAGQLANPTLELYSGSTLIALNDDWKTQPDADRQAVIDSTIPPSNDLESALVRTLPANGAGYTAIVRGVNSGTGIGIVEAYDLDRTVDSRLANISTRGLVQTGDNVLIAGTIILGPAPQKVIVRALGPSLTVPGKMENPTLELRNQNGAVIEANDNWMDSPNKQAIIDSTIPPANDLESAIVQTLPANGASYTAIVRGVNNATGIAVVEIYGLP